MKIWTPTMTLKIIALGVVTAIVSLQVCYSDSLDTVIVTSSRLDEVPSPDSFISGDQVRDTALVLSLGRLPGVIAFSNGGLGGSSYFAVRGGEPNFTLILIDGIRVNDPSNSAGGAFDLNQLDPAIISKVQLNKLGASPIHGPGALSGVLHVETNSPLEHQVFNASVSATVQSENAWAASGQASHNWGSGGIIVSYAARDTGALSGESDLRRDLALLKLEQDFPVGALRLTGLFGMTDRFAYPEDSGAETFAPNLGLEERETKLGAVGATYQLPIKENISLAMTGNFSRQNAFSNIPALPAGVLNGVPARTDESVFERSELLSYLRYTPTETLGLIAGASLVEEDGRGDGVLDLGFLLPTSFQKDRSIMSVFVEAGLKATPELRLNGALRWDDPDDQSSKTTGGFSIVYAISEHVSIEGNYAESYKLPSIFATDFPLIANPDLRPETSESLDVGFVVTGSKGMYFSIRGFQNRFANLIDFDPILFTNVNRNRVATAGGELFWLMPLGESFSLSGSVGVLDFETFGEPPLRSRPKSTVNLKLDWKPSSAVEGYISFASASSTYSSSIPTGLIELDGAARLAAGVSWRPNEQWRVSVDLSNLTDNEYSFAVGVSEPGANIAATVSRRF